MLRAIHLPRAPCPPPRENTFVLDGANELGVGRRSLKSRAILADPEGRFRERAGMRNAIPFHAESFPSGTPFRDYSRISAYHFVPTRLTLKSKSSLMLISNSYLPLNSTLFYDNRKNLLRHERIDFDTIRNDFPDCL